MVEIMVIDKDGKELGGNRMVEDHVWDNLQKFGRMLRWKKVEKISIKKEVKKLIKKEEKDGEECSDIGNAV